MLEFPSGSIKYLWTKMAPLFVASRLPLLPFLCIVLFLSLLSVEWHLYWCMIAWGSWGSAILWTICRSRTLAIGQDHHLLLWRLYPLTYGVYLGYQATAIAEDEEREVELWKLNWLRTPRTTPAKYCWVSPVITPDTTSEAPWITPTDGFCRPHQTPGTHVPVAGLWGSADGAARLRISVQLTGPPNRRIGVWFAWLWSTPDPFQIRHLS